MYCYSQLQQLPSGHADTSRMSLAIVLCVAPTDLNEDRPPIKNDVTAIPLTGLFTLLSHPLTPLQTARLMWQTFQ